MKKILALIALLAVVWFGFQLWYSRALNAVDSSDVRTLFKVEKGASTAKITEDLYAEQLIRSPFAFKMYVKRSGTAGSLKAGTFVLTSSMASAEIAEVLAGGKSAEEILTIPEGFTVKDIDSLLAEKGIIKAGEIQDCARTCDFSTFTFLPENAAAAPRGGKLEGYLYPDTYYVTLDGFVPKFFLERLLTTFRHKVVEDLATDIKASGRTLEDIMIVASLVEEETRTSAERPVVAGIIWKRFDQKMGLGIDAAVRYVLNKPTDTITVADLDTDSPYNLRKFRGLPPTPIASPSLSSIKAALHPETTPYFYYLHGKDGAIRYAVTNDEHNVNRAKYLQ